MSTNKSNIFKNIITTFYKEEYDRYIITESTYDKPDEFWYDLYEYIHFDIPIGYFKLRDKILKSFPQLYSTFVKSGIFDIIDFHISMGLINTLLFNLFNFNDINNKKYIDGSLRLEMSQGNISNLNEFNNLIRSISITRYKLSILLLANENYYIDDNNLVHILDFIIELDRYIRNKYGNKYEDKFLIHYYINNPEILKRTKKLLPNDKRLILLKNI